MNYPDTDDLYDGKFTDGNPITGIAASEASADHMNAVYDELINVIEAAGITPDASSTDQLLTALEFYRNASHLNAGTIPIARMNGSNTMFEKNIVSAPAFQLDDDVLKNAAELTVAVNGVAYIYDEGANVLLPDSMTVGTDYAIYATADGLIASDNFTVPDDYTTETSRRVGGFHYQNGEINEYSLYDIKYRPAARNAYTGEIDARGMVRVPGFGWADIYLLNISPEINGTSAYNVTIADGSNTPIIPTIWGGDGTTQYNDFNQYTATRVLAAFGKRLPNSHEFETLAYGSVMGYELGVDPVTTQFDDSAKSRIGCEQVSGHMSQWGSERWDRGTGVGTDYSWYEEDENNEGQVYAISLLGVGAVIFGGTWVESGTSGPRTSSWNKEPGGTNLYISARGVCDHFESF